MTTNYQIRRLAVALLAAVVLVWLVPPAVGAHAGPKTLTRLTRQMNRHFGKKQYRAALAIAQKLVFVHKQSVYLANIALCHDLLNEDLKALTTYRQYLRRYPVAKNRPAIERRLKMVLTRLRSHSRLVTISAHPAEAQLFIDGKGQGKSNPLTTWLRFGRHSIEARANGFRSETRKLAIRSGPKLNLTLKLKPIPTLGTLLVTSDPVGSLVALNGRTVGATPLKKRLNRGSYTVKITYPGRKSYTTRLSVNVDKVTRVYAKLRLAAPKTRGMSGYRIGAWVTLGVGIALVGVGAGLNVLANKRIRDTNNSLLNTPLNQQTDLFITDYLARQDKSRRMFRAGVALMAVGGASLAASLVLFLMKLKKQEADVSGFSILPRHNGVVGRLTF